VSVTNGAANVIPRVHLGTYIFISFSIGEVGRDMARRHSRVQTLIERLNKENHSGHT